MSQEPARSSLTSSQGNSLIDAVADWLMIQALESTSAEKLLKECSLRLTAAGVPLWRSSIAFQILHPLYQAMSLTWWRESGMEPVSHFSGDPAQSKDWQKSPQFFLVENNLPFLRRRLIGEESILDFPVLDELKDQGATDYLVYMVPFSAEELVMNTDGITTSRDGMVGSWTTDRAGGFTDEDIKSLLRIQQRLGVACKMTLREQITKNVLSAYLGSDAGDQVLKGHIKLGDGDTIHAVIWFSDLRNSSGLADSLPTDEYLTLVNNYFDCTAGAVIANDGEVLRFIGDAVLAIFPIRKGEVSESEACKKALAASADASQRLEILNDDRRDKNQPPLAFGLGLHVGDVMYGNIGVPERVEFSVVGPAANEVARLEDLTKSLGRQILVSEHFADALDMEWDSLGAHELRGVGEPMEVFAPSVPIGKTIQ